jgi:DeoR/GlpR family transcriptional regulator of sugar metabolism
MSVSHMTVRRDIQLLEEEGKVIAINGGVKAQ